MSEILLEAREFEKIYCNDDLLEKRSRRRLWHIESLKLETCGLIVIGGRNGAGKSTLLRCLLGLMRPTRGTVSWFGKKGPPSEGVGYLPELPVIPPAVKVRQWLAWLLDISAREIETIESSLSRFPSLSVKSFLDVPANRLSKGQQQRVQLWAALARNPRGVVLDEPFSGLDPWARVELAELVQGVLAEGRFVMMSTHELPQSLRDTTLQTWLVQNETVEIFTGSALPA